MQGTDNRIEFPAVEYHFVEPRVRMLRIVANLPAPGVRISEGGQKPNAGNSIFERLEREANEEVDNRRDNWNYVTREIAFPLKLRGKHEVSPLGVASETEKTVSPVRFGTREDSPGGGNSGTWPKFGKPCAEIVWRSIRIIGVRRRAVWCFDLLEASVSLRGEGRCWL